VSSSEYDLPWEEIRLYAKNFYELFVLDAIRRSPRRDEQLVVREEFGKKRGKIKEIMKRRWCEADRLRWKPVLNQRPRVLIQPKPRKYRVHPRHYMNHLFELTQLGEQVVSRASRAFCAPVGEERRRIFEHLTSDGHPINQLFADNLSLSLALKRAESDELLCDAVKGSSSSPVGVGLAAKGVICASLYFAHKLDSMDLKKFLKPRDRQLDRVYKKAKELRDALSSVPSFEPAEEFLGQLESLCVNETPEGFLTPEDYLMLTNEGVNNFRALFVRRFYLLYSRVFGRGLARDVAIKEGRPAIAANFGYRPAAPVELIAEVCGAFEVCDDLLEPDSQEIKRAIKKVEGDLRRFDHLEHPRSKRKIYNVPTLWSYEVCNDDLLKYWVSVRG